MDRGCGILLAVSSLPGAFECGTLGAEALSFIDALAAAGQKYWQILPLCPRDRYGSPYQSVSAFAGDISYIDPPTLFSDGLLTESELKECEKLLRPGLSAEEGRRARRKLFRGAFERGREPLAESVAAFRRENAFWAEDYALFTVLTLENAWTDGLCARDGAALARAREEYADGVSFEIFLQYLFFEQWARVRERAGKLGVSIIGDMPIYVSGGSADVWQEPRFFRKDAVAGCPPDAFCENGQIWGSPVYDWDCIRRDGYGFFIRRTDRALKLFDVVRVDHFRGFEAFWSIPADAPSAAAGRWEKAPGRELFSRLTGWFGALPFIAEDLGTLTPEFFAFEKECGFPGMRVLQFAFAPYADSIYLPHNLTENAVVYTGTHDNDTTLSWFSKLPPAEKEYLSDYLGGCTEENVCEKMIRAAMSSVCRLCVLPMQDVLGQGGDRRMNEPGRTNGKNWKYRLRAGEFSEEERKKLRRLCEIYAR